MKKAAVLLIAITLLGCEKEQNRRLLDAYFKFTVNGTEKVIKDGAGLYENTFTCVMYGDTAVYINVSKSDEGAGFFIKAPLLQNGTYILDDKNRAYYNEPVEDNQRRYITTSTSTGQVTIERGTFEAKSTLNILKGTFSYQVKDTLTGATLDLTNGSFLMEITEK